MFGCLFFASQSTRRFSSIFKYFILPLVGKVIQAKDVAPVHSSFSSSASLNRNKSCYLKYVQFHPGLFSCVALTVGIYPHVVTQSQDTSTHYLDRHLSACCDTVTGHITGHINTLPRSAFIRMSQSQDTSTPYIGRHFYRHVVTQSQDTSTPNLGRHLSACCDTVTGHINTEPRSAFIGML